MCGIAGILSTQLDPTRITTALEAMQQALIHRGPDGRGDYFSHSKSAALAHTRLAIIELGESGAQPMTTPDQRYTISFNGEIYNYQTLRDELVDAGAKFIGHSDTEVILHLYKRHGVDCVHKMRGMFAFMIWDEEHQIGFAARDPLGIKPLYYWRDKHTLAFASEIRAVIASQLSSQKLDGNGLDSYFKTGTVAEPNTLITDIKMLPAAHTLSWQAGKITIKPYWSIQFNQQTMDRENAIAITRSALEDSIRAHFVSDVPVGIFLSGGIDSSALVAIAKKVTDKTIRTYSIAFEDPEWNEGDIAKRVANHFGTQHTEYLLTPEQARPLFDEFLETIDQPTIDGFNTFCVSKFAHDQGEKVVLSGLGGDELFAGYKSFKLLPKMVSLSKTLAWLAPVTRFGARLFNRSISPRGRRILDVLSQPGSLVSAQQSLRGIFSELEARTLTDSFNAQSDGLATVEPRQSQLADNISELEVSTYMRNQLLRDSDVTSMAWGLELRVPFVDQALIDKISVIPAEYRLEQGKRLLIDSVPELPEWVVNRPKQGFRFPFDQWFSADWQSINVSHSVPSWIALTPWYRRWSLVVLSHWVSHHVR